MSAGRFAAGFGIAVVALGPLVIAAVVLRIRLLPRWRGAAARLAEAVLVLGVLTLIDQLLGVIGVFSRWPVVSVCASTGAVTVGAVWRRPATAVVRRAEDRPPAPTAERTSIVLVTAVTALVTMQWLAPTLDALHNGMQRSFDTLWYHGPTAARFVQQASITSIHYFDDNAATAFFPGGSALLHATGILLVGNDVLSPVLNLLFFALALLAAWVIGQRLGSGPAGLLGVAVVLGTPTLVMTQPGGDYNDVVGLALILCAVALLFESELRGFGLLLAAVAAGLAIGVKFTMLAPVGALTLGLAVIVWRTRFCQVMLVWFASLMATAGVWYARNLVVAGSPLPGPGVALGPLRLHRLPSTTPIDTVAHYLTNWSVVRNAYGPGLDTALGDAWPAILLGAVLGGLLVAWRSRNGFARVIGCTAVVAFVAFLVTPQYLGTPNFPFFFGVNVRYAVTALALGLVVLASLPWFQSPLRLRALVVSLGVAVAITQIHASDLWPVATRYAVASAAVVVVIGAAWLIVASGVPASHLARLMLGAVAALAAIAGMWVVQRHYLTNRYTDVVDRKPVIATLRHRTHVRIGTEGYFLQYPLYGPDLSNYVQYLGQRGQYGAFAPFTACPAWARAVNAGRYDYLLVAEPSYPSPKGTSKPVPALGWARAQGAALQEIASDDSHAATFRVLGPLDPSACPR